MITHCTKKHLKGLAKVRLGQGCPPMIVIIQWPVLVKPCSVTMPIRKYVICDTAVSRMQFASAIIMCGIFSLETSDAKYIKQASRENLLDLFNLCFWKGKTFFPNFCEMAFLAFILGTFKIVLKCPLRAYFAWLQKFPGGGPPDPYLWHWEQSHTLHNRCVASRHIAMHCTAPHKIFWVKRKGLKLQISG